MNIADRIGRYTITQEIGRGGMAAVFRALDPSLDRSVAIKLLPREFAYGPDFLARFQREARTLATLEHPSIVPIYDYGEHEGQPYIVMRLMEGGSLQERLQRGPLPREEIARIISNVAAALDYAHSRGIIHRDIKPANILFDSNGNAYLVDFGIAKLLERGGTQLTGTGNIFGTPVYMSPEQAMGERTLDRRSDVYALGVVVYEMITGRSPYSGDTPMAVILKQINDPVPRFSSGELTTLGLPQSTNDIIAKVLAKKPDDRYATAGALAADIASLFAGVSAPTPTGYVSVSPPPPPTASTSTMVGPTPHPTTPPAGLPQPVSKEQPPSAVERFADWLKKTLAPSPTPTPPPARPPPADVTLVRLPHLGPTVVSTAPPSGTMFLRRGLEAVISPSNDAIIEDWLDLYSAKQLGQKLLRSGEHPHLLLTGYGSFGGTSLVKGITKRMAAESGAGDTLLALRLETGRHHRISLYVNERKVGTATVADPPERRALAAKVEAALRSEEESDPSPAVSPKAEAIAALLIELLDTLDGQISNTALDAALKRACKQHSQRLIIFFDRIDRHDLMAALLESCIVDHPQVSAVVIARREKYDEWPADIQLELDDAGFDEWYVRRLWDRDVDLTRELSQLLVRSLPAGDDETQQKMLDLLFDHLAFKARGSLGSALRELKDERGWLQDNAGQMLDISGKFMSNREEIEHNAHVHRLLKRNYHSILQSLFNDAPGADRALVGVHYLMDWIRKHPIFTRAQLDDAAKTQPITVSDQEPLVRTVTDNLLQLLRAEGYVAGTEESFRVSWRQPIQAAPPPPPASKPPEPFPVAAVMPAPSTIVAVAPVHPPPTPPKGPLRIGLIGGPSDAPSRANAIAAQLAFEIMESGHRLITTDRPGVDLRLHRKLWRYWQARADTVMPGTEPVTIVAVSARPAESPYVAVTRAASAAGQLEELLDESDALIVVGGDTSAETIFSLDNIRLAAKRRNIPLIPVGSADEAIAQLWAQTNDSISEQFAGRVTGAQFAEVGPKSPYIPDVARSTMRLVEKILQ